MLRWVVFDTTMFDGDDESSRTQKNVCWLLEALAQRDQEFLRRRPNTPRLYKSGVRYMSPQQFAGDVEEVAVLKAALGKAAKQSTVKKALDTVQDVLGGERFRDIGRILENGGGDCFPTSTKFLRKTTTGAVRISGSDLRCEDRIWGRGRWSRVRAIADKGVLSVDGLHLADDRDFLLTRGHKVFVVDSSGAVRRITVGQLEPGMDMLAPRRGDEWQTGVARPVIPWLDDEEYWAPIDFNIEQRVRVTGVTRDVERLACLDVETDDHTIYLPVEDVYVSNCDNLSAWRAAELRQAGIPASPFMTSRKRLDGGTTYHALVVWPSLRELVRLGLLTEASIQGRPDVDYQTTEDPSLLLGMGGDRRQWDRAEEQEKNKERTDLFKLSRAQGAVATPSLDDVLGLRRHALQPLRARPAPNADRAIAELDALFGRVA